VADSVDPAAAWRNVWCLLEELANEVEQLRRPAAPTTLYAALTAARQSGRGN